MKILYVENHSVFARNVIGQFLSQHLVTLVPSLSAAREQLLHNSFDVLLVDYDLDDGKGDELVREVRKENRKELVIGVSSHDEGNSALLVAGASAVCSKMMFDHIQNIIEGAQDQISGGHT